MEQTREHLRLLSIFHYVLAGIVALFSLIPFVHLAIGLAALLNPEFLSGGQSANDEFGNKLFGTIFTAVGSVAILMGFTTATLIFLAGKKLAAHRNHTFCFVVAAVECLFAPFGTVLGVFTIIVLMKPEARQLFGLPPVNPPAV